MIEKAMKTLLVLRHAKSSWKEQDLPDHDRPLNKRGKNDALRNLSFNQYKVEGNIM
jgi:phosphohistidine phosphatase SixA